MKITHMLFTLFLLVNVNLFADDFMFISPQPGQTVQGPMTIKSYAPYKNKSIKVWIESESGWERVVWRGKLTAKNNYTVTVDTSQFKPGPYKLEGSFWINFEDYDAELEFWVGGNNANGTYYPQ